MDDAERLLRADLRQLGAAASPAIDSSCPKCAIAPSFADSAAPELIDTTGIFAAVARASTSFIASGLASVTMMPSTFWSMAAWTSWACLPPSGSAEYRNSTLSLAAAALAPFCTMSQKVSPRPSA